MNLADLPAHPKHLHGADARPGMRVLVVTRHHVLRVLTVTRLSGRRITLQDGSRYHSSTAADDVVRPYGPGPHPGTLHVLPASLDSARVNAEYEAWSAQRRAQEADRARRAELAADIRTVSRNLSSAGLQDFDARTLQTLLQGLRQAVQPLHL